MTEPANNDRRELLRDALAALERMPNFISRKLECSSWDLKNGTSGRKCGPSCQYFDWYDDSEGKRKPPKCSVNYNFLCGLVGDPDQVLRGIVVVPFTKSATGAGKQLISSGTARNMLWSHVYRATPVIKPFDDGDAFVPRITDVRVTTEGERLVASKIHDALREMRDRIRVQYQETASGDEGEGEDDDADRREYAQDVVDPM